MQRKRRVLMGLYLAWLLVSPLLWATRWPGVVLWLLVSAAALAAVLCARLVPQAGGPGRSSGRNAVASRRGSPPAHQEA